MIFRHLFAILLAFAAALASPVHANEAASRPVKLFTVKPEGLRPERVFFGRVVAKETVDLAFQVGGQILDFPVTQGDTIPAGTVVAQLDLEPFELALEQAALQKDQTIRTVERYNQLIGTAVSRASREDAETAASIADVNYRNASYDLEHATIFSPFDAVVAERLVANYSTVSVGTPVVTLHDMSDLRIEIDVPEILFQRAGPEPDLTITAEFPTSEEVFPVQIREFRAESSEIGQTFKVILGMSPPEGLVLLPGSSATVRSRIADDSTPPIIPASSVDIATDGTTSVLVFEPSGENSDTGTLRRQSVAVTPAPHGGMFAGEGLKAGDQIVATGLTNLENGMTVRRFDGFPE